MGMGAGFGQGRRAKGGQANRVRVDNTIHRVHEVIAP